METGIVFENIYYKTKFGLRRDPKQILHGLTGHLPASSLTAILGPSGSGKTTLLNILSGCLHGYQGTVTIRPTFHNHSKLSANKQTETSTENLNSDRLSLLDEDFNDDPTANFDYIDAEDDENTANNNRNKVASRAHSTFKSKIHIKSEKDTVLAKSDTYRLGYIQQESHLCDLLTVMETFEFAADIKIRQQYGEPCKVRAKIEEIMDTLGLKGVADTRVCSLSGGERKRLTIGLELLSNFDVILLDEPTTGLDSYSTQICIDYLKNLASKGKTIVCTIHQPSAMILEKFDYLYVLADGYCLYEGHKDRMLSVLDEYHMSCPYFHNPADYKIGSGDYGSGKDSIKSILIDRFHRTRCYPPKKAASVQSMQSSSSLLASSRIDNDYTSSWSMQLWSLLRREYLKARRNPTLTYLRLITSVTNSLVLCAIFWKVGSDGAKVLFNFNAILGVVLHFMMPSLMLTVLTFPSEYAVLKRESINRWYSLKWYYTALTLIDLPISIVYCLISSAIFYNLSDQPQEQWRFWMFTLFGFLICVIAQSLGLLVGSVMNVLHGTLVGSAISFPLMSFAGFGVTFKDIPVYLKWFAKFSYLKYGVEGMAASVMGYNRTHLECSEKICLYQDSQHFLDEIGADSHQLGLDVGVLIGIYLLLRVCGYCVLKLRLHYIN